MAAVMACIVIDTGLRLACIYAICDSNQQERRAMYTWYIACRNNIQHGDGIVPVTEVSKCMLFSLSKILNAPIIYKISMDHCKFPVFSDIIIYSSSL